MRRGVVLIAWLSLVLVGLVMPESAAASVMADMIGRKASIQGQFCFLSQSQVCAPQITYATHAGLSRRHMLQDSTETEAQTASEETSSESIQESVSGDITEVPTAESAIHTNATSSETPAVEPLTESAAAAETADDQDAGNTSSIATSTESSSGTEDSVVTSSDNQMLEVDADQADGQHSSSSSELDRIILAEDEAEDSSISSQSLQNEEDDVASSLADQAATASNATEGETSPAGADIDNSPEAGLTFDEALAQTAASEEQLNSTSGSIVSSNSTSDDLTFDEAVAATKGTQSISDVIANSTQPASSELKALDPRDATPVLESHLPTVESLNGSLRAAIKESEAASNVTAGDGIDSTFLEEIKMTGIANTTASLLGEELTKTVNASEGSFDKVHTLANLPHVFAPHACYPM